MTTQHTLRAIAGDLTIIETRWPEYLAARALLAPSPLKATRTDGQPTGRGGHADPTLNHIIATHGEPTPDDDTEDAIHATRTQVRWIRDNIERTIAATQHRPRTDREQRHYDADMRANQCETTNPDGNRCPNQAARNGTCWTHIKQAQRADEHTILDNVHTQPLEHATVNHRAPVEPTLPARHTASITCGKCGWGHTMTGNDEPTLHAALRAELTDHPCTHP